MTFFLGSNMQWKFNIKYEKYLHISAQPGQRRSKRQRGLDPGEVEEQPGPHADPQAAPQPDAQPGSQEDPQPGPSRIGKAGPSR